MERSLQALLLLGLVATSSAAWSRTWYGPDNPEVTVAMPDGKEWNRLPPKPPAANGMVTTSVMRADGTKMVGTTTRSGLPDKELTPKITQFIEEGNPKDGMTKVDSARFLLDGNRAFRLVTRGMIGGRDTVHAEVFVVLDGTLYTTEAMVMASAGNPFDDPELAAFLLSLHLPPGDGAKRAVPAPGFSVVLPTGDGWLRDKDVSKPLLVSLDAADHSGVINVLRTDEAPTATLDQTMITAIDRELYGSGKTKKRSGQLFDLPSGDHAYFTIGTTETTGGTPVTMAGTYTVANGHLFAVSALAKGNPLLDPTLNRALFSLSTQ